MRKNVLIEIVEKFPYAWENPQFVKSYLLKKFPEEKLARNLILACIEENIPHDLVLHQSCNREELRDYAGRVVSAYDCSYAKAKEAVYSWAEALKISNLPSWQSLYPGHEKCETLRAIRKKIARANHIPFRTEECTHEGPCLGTCPACDAEIRYLDAELQKKKDRGERINIRGIAEDDIMRAGVDIPVQDEGSSRVYSLIEDRELTMGSYSMRRRNTVQQAESEKKTGAELTSGRLGRKSLEEVEEKLKAMGLSLASDSSSDKPRQAESKALDEDFSMGQMIAPDDDVSSFSCVSETEEIMGDIIDLD